MRVSFVYFLASGIIQNLFTFSLDIGPEQVLINLILLLLSIYSVYKLNCTVVSGKHIGRRVAQRCCCGGIHVHVHCTVHETCKILSAWSVTHSAQQHWLTHVWLLYVSVLFLSMHLAVIFTVLCIPERLQLFYSSTTAYVKVLTKENNRDQHHSRTRKPPASGKLRSKRTLDLTSRRKERTLEQILIIYFIIFRHQFELVWFARNKLTAWAIRYPYMWARNKAKIGLQC